MDRKWLYLLAAVCVTVFIFSNSLKNADSSGTESALLLGILNSIPPFAKVTHNALRKAAHVTEFAVQGFFLAAFFGLLTACTDEFIQLFSAGRSSEVRDVFIDFSGTVAALLIFAAVRYLGRKCKGKIA